MRRTYSLDDLKSYIGKKYNSLTIIDVVQKEIGAKNRNNFIVRCDCGKIKQYRISKILHNEICTCGCQGKNRATNHGFGHTHLYAVWNSMRKRCGNPKSAKYNIYGGRGIKVCDEWNNNFLVFREWALSNGYKEGLSIDRIDNNGNYEPNNCRWTTLTEQARNRRNTKYITYKGQTKSLAEWCEILKLPPSTIGWRIRKWKDIERAFEEPITNSRPKKA